MFPIKLKFNMRKKPQTLYFSTELLSKRNATSYPGILNARFSTKIALVYSTIIVSNIFSTILLLEVKGAWFNFSELIFYSNDMSNFGFKFLLNRSNLCNT